MKLIGWSTVLEDSLQKNSELKGEVSHAALILGLYNDVELTKKKNMNLTSLQQHSTKL